MTPDICLQCKENPCICDEELYDESYDRSDEIFYEDEDEDGLE